MTTKASNKPLVGQRSAAQRVCVLAGSIGGPTGLSRFFQSLQGCQTSVAFVVIMPISPDSVPLLCDFIARQTSMRVLPALSGYNLRHEEVVVMPSDRLLMIDSEGKMNLLAPVDKVLNAIDITMQALARYYRKNTGAIIFSGIGEDGQQGCRTIVEHGGEVWTQSKESCQFDSLPRYVFDTCTVKFSSSPENLAAHMQRELMTIKAVSG